MNEYDGPVPFKNANYYFKVGLGEVEGPDEINWVEWMEVEGFSQLLLLLQMWDMYASNPATEIKMWYKDNE